MTTPAGPRPDGATRRVWLWLWPRAGAWGLWIAVLAALSLVFTAYLDPHFAVDLASRLWTCF
jgi:hypothetical protein